MRTLIRIGFTNVRRDRVVLAMIFVMPIIFFSIFASVFGARAGGTAKIRIELSNRDGALRPEMFADVTMEVPLGRSVAVPESAVLQTGTRSIIFVAALQSIPEELYEAARIDGASALQQFRHVTLPMLSPTFVFVGIITAQSKHDFADRPLFFHRPVGTRQRSYWFRDYLRSDRFLLCRSPRAPTPRCG